MARMHTTPRFPVGTRVLKRFPGYAEPFSGEIDVFLPDSGFYHVRYDDGDSEEMTEDDVDRHYSGGPRKSKKRPKVVVAPPPSAPAPSPKSKPASKPDAKKPRTKMLLLSTNASKRAIVEEEDEAALADTEEEEAEEDGEPGEAEAKIVTSPDAIHKLVGQRVCKRQGEGNATIVSGTVSSYFPATKMYRVVYVNGTTDDMTYREVVDSIPLSATGTAKSKKRKPTDEGGATPPASAETPSQSPKKRKLGEAASVKESVMADENVNNENTHDAGDSQTTQPNGADADSIMTMPTVDKDSFVWNRANAYDTVRAVVYTVVSTTKETSKPLQILEDKGLKAKVALMTFVECGGLTTLEERLSSWCKTKETEPGVLAILKVLAVLPGVSTDTVLLSKIGQTLSHIRKRKADLVSPHFDPIVREMASYVIAKWKKEFSGVADKKKSSNAGKEAESKSSMSSAGSKPIKTSNTKSESSSNNTSLKRSNSVGHLRELISGPRGSLSRNNDVLGNSLSKGRPGSRPLGAPHARSARRSTVLLDSIKSRLIKDAEKSSPTTGDRPTLKADVWTASRVKFGGHSTLEFDNEIEVSQLLIAPTPGAIRPFKSKSGPVKPPPPEKQPAKSILRVKLAPAEREAIALKAGENSLATETMALNSVTLADSSTSMSTARPSIGDDKQDQNDEVEGSGEREEDDGEVSARAAPPSPPRKHDASQDEDEGEDPELLQMPDDLVIGDAPSPPSSDAAADKCIDDSESAAMVVDEVGDVETRATQRAPSPEVSSDSSSAESGEIEEDEDNSHPRSPFQSGPTSSSPPQQSSVETAVTGEGIEADSVMKDSVEAPSA